MNLGTISKVLGVAYLVTVGSACGGAQTKTDSAPASAARGPIDAGAPDAPKERPFASSPMEAQSMIQSAIDGQVTALWKCVEDYRTRVKDPHKQVVVDVGIDQEGILMAVTTATPKKGDLEPVLKGCLYQALRDLPFPRSHAGVITVRESLKDTAVYQ